jgi:NitT/TauT family transport system permease protein
MSVPSSVAAGRPSAGFALTRRQIVILGRIAFGLGFILLWEWGARQLGPLLLSPASAVAARIYEVIASGELFGHLYITLLEGMEGLAIGASVGVLVPLLFRRYPRLADACLPYIRGMMGIPKLALTPLFILWFGIGIASKVVLVSLICFFMVFEPTYAGLRAVDRRLEMMARILGASDFQVTRKIMWKSILPFIFAALKTALPWSVSAAVVGEFISGQAGMGYMINHARDLGDVTGVCAWVVIVTFVVIGLDVVLSKLQGRALSWRAVDSRATL